MTASPDFGIDTSAPTTGIVRDGSSIGVDVSYNTGSLSSLSSNWSVFADAASGIAKYEYSVGTTAGGTNILTWTSTGATSVTQSGLTLTTGQLYYFNVRALDLLGNVSSTVSSNGQSIAPTLSFSVSSSAITFDRLSASNSYTSTKSIDVTTSTNAYGGYVVRQFTPGLLSNGSSTIQAYTGTYASPTSWTGTGFGYTTNDLSIQASGNIFNGGTRYSRLSTSAPGEIVADHTSAVAGTPIVSEVFTIGYRITAGSTQAAGSYSGQIGLGVSAIY